MNKKIEVKLSEVKQLKYCMREVEQSLDHINGVLYDIMSILEEILKNTRDIKYGE